MTDATAPHSFRVNDDARSRNGPASKIEAAPNMVNQIVYETVEVDRDAA